MPHYVRMKDGVKPEMRTWRSLNGDFTIEPGDVGKILGEYSSNGGNSVEWLGYPTEYEAADGFCGWTTGPGDVEYFGEFTEEEMKQKLSEMGEVDRIMFLIGYREKQS